VHERRSLASGSASQRLRAEDPRYGTRWRGGIDSETLGKKKQRHFSFFTDAKRIKMSVGVALRVHLTLLRPLTTQLRNQEQKLFFGEHL
jgi:hypothetical protein